MNLTKVELDQVVKQYEQGLLHEFEFLIKLQMSPVMIERILLAQKLPFRAVAKLSIDDLHNDDPRLPFNVPDDAPAP